MQPYTLIENLTNAGIAKRQTASVYLNKLTQAKVLSSAQFGRSKLFVNPAFLRLHEGRGRRVEILGSNPCTRDAEVFLDEIVAERGSPVEVRRLRLDARR